MSFLLPSRASSKFENPVTRLPWTIRLPYLDQHGFPQHPSELEGHQCLGFVRPSTGRPIAWCFREDKGQPFELEPTKRLLCSGDFLGCVGLANPPGATPRSPCGC